MKQEDKTHADLLTELKRLQQENTMLKTAIENTKGEHLALENALMGDDGRFQELFNNAPLGYQSLDINGYFLEVNQQWLTTLGYTYEEVIGHWFGDFLTPAFQDGFRKRFPIFKAQGFIHSEFEMLHKNGSILFIAFDGRIGYDEKGEFKQTHCVLQDITQVKKAEDTLRESELQFRNLANSGLALIWTSGTDKLCNFFNETWLRYTGRTLQQEIGNGWAEGVHPDDFDHCLSIYTTAFDNQQPFQMEYRLRHASGEYRWLLDMGTPNYNSNKKFVGYIGHCFDITERKIIADSLKESQRRLSTLMGNLFGMAYRCKNNKDWPLEYVSKGCLELTGYTDAELLNNIISYNDLIDPDYQDYVFDSVQIALSRKESFRLEYKIHTKEGTEKWVLEHGCGIYSENNEVLALEGFITDISDRKKTETDLFESEERFKALHNASFGGIGIHDNGKILECNQGLSDMMGYTRDELIKMDGLLLIAPDFRPLVSEKIASGYEKPYEAIGLRKNGDIFPMRLEARNIPYKGKQVRTVEFRDITEAKQAEEALKISNQKFQGIFNNLQDAFFQANLSGNLTLISPSAPAIYGYASTEEMMGIPAVNLYADASQRENLIKELSKKGIVRDFVGQGKKKDGSTFWLSMNIQLTYQNGKVSGTEGVVRDITQRKQAEAALVHSHDLMRYVIENNNGAIAIHDKDLKYIYVSQRYLHDYKVKEKDIIGKHHYEVLPDLPQKWRDVHQKALRGEISRADNDPYPREDGTMEYTRWECRPWFEVDGSIGGIIIYTEVITERIQAEEALKENNARLELAMNTANLAWWEMDIATGNVLFDKHKTDMLGQTPENFKHYKDFMALVHPNDNEKTMNAMRMHIDGRAKRYEAEYRIKTVSGDYKWFYDIGSIVKRDAKGKPLTITGLVLDIDKRKHIELALKKGEEKFRHVFESANVGKSITLPNGELNVNRAFCEMLGYTAKELQKKKWQDLTPADEIDSIQKETESLLKGEKKSTRFIKRYIHKNGSFVWADLSIVVHCDTNNKPLFFITTVIDITERKQVEEELLKSESKYSTLFTTMTEGFALHEIICDAKGKPVDYRFLDINPAFETLTGIKKAEIIGKTVLSIMPNTERFWIEKYGNVALTGKPTEFESYTKSLSRYYQIKAFCPAKNQFAVIFSDISEQKQNEKKIARHADELSMLNQFSIELAGLSSTENIEATITKKIKEMSGAETSIFSVYNPADRTLTVKEIEMEPGILEKSVGLLGKQIKKMQTHVDEKMYIEMTREIIGVRQSLHEVSFGSIPRPIAAGLQALLKVDRFIGIAYMVEGVLYGTNLLTLKKGQPFLSRDILENFINLASVSLQRRRAEKSLKVSEEKYRTIFNNVQDVFYQTNLEGIVLEISPSIKYFSEFKRDEILGHPVENLYNDPNDRVPLLKEIMNFGELKDYELKLKTKNGTIKHVSVNARLIRDHNGNPHHIDGSLRDISERKQIEIAKEKEMRDMRVFHNLTINRELKMIELKREINELASKAGEDPRYHVPEV